MTYKKPISLSLQYFSSTSNWTAWFEKKMSFLFGGFTVSLHSQMQLEQNSFTLSFLSFFYIFTKFYGEE